VSLGEKSRVSCAVPAAGAAFACTKVVSVDFGYRYLSIDYTHDKCQLDTAMAGPYFGVGFHF